jgi:hypothetical protein
MTEEEMKVVETMQEFGGSFVKALASCFYRADPLNFQRLRKAFPEYWNEYREKADNKNK